MDRFDLWMHRVNRHLTETLGLEADDFEDYNWHDDYMSGLLPIDAAEDFVLSLRQEYSDDGA